MWVQKLLEELKIPYFLLIIYSFKNKKRSVHMNLERCPQNLIEPILETIYIIHAKIFLFRKWKIEANI
jgi:hypothetical protein